MSIKKLSHTHSYTAEDDDWNTPEKYVAAVKKVLGDIELDPCTNAEAQKVINSHVYYTKENNALQQKWEAKSAFMNPPYSRVIKDFVDRWCLAINDGDIKNGITLTNAATDTGWWHNLATRADAVCFTDHRIGFVKQGQALKQNPKGQCFFLFTDRDKGKDWAMIARFMEVFDEFGFVVDL